MRKILLKITVVLFVVGVVTACDDYLTQDVAGSLSDKDFYKNEADALNGLTAVYDAYQNTYNAIWPSMYLIRDIPSDDVNAGGADENDQAGFQQIDDFEHDSQNDQIQGAWQNLWRAVYRANKVVNNTTPSSDMMKRIIAEAKVLRAFLYLDLVSFWGGVPIILEELGQDDYTTQARATKQQVFAQIQKDLTEAIPDLPLKTTYGAGDKFRVSKGTAQALLGKAYLYDEKYTEAAAQFESVITSNEFSLENDVARVFDRRNEFGKESLFELNYVDFMGNDWGNYAWGNSMEDNIIIELMGPRGDYYTPAPGDSLIGGWGFNTPKKELFDAYVAAGDLNRRRKFVMSEVELETAGGEWDDVTVHDYEGYFRRKYGSYENQTNGPVLELNYATNFVLLRYADVLLMAAEANNKKPSPDDAKARTYVNMVRQRPSTGLPALSVTLSGTALFDAIVLERRLELAFEGHRFPDLVRWGRAAAELSNLGFVAGKHEVLPIPNVDVIAAKLQQNPGY